MKNLFGKFIKEENGDVVQYIIVLAVVAIILAFAFPKIKAKMSNSVNGTLTNIDNSQAGM